jgi:anti-anti-sigma factor
VSRPFNGLIVRRQPLDGAVCLSLSGEVDLANASDLRAHLKAVAQNDTNLILDMGDLRYMDSSGIQTLVDAHRTFKQTNRQMALASVPPMIQKILNITGVDRLVPVFASIETALKGLNGNARP